MNRHVSTVYLIGASVLSASALAADDGCDVPILYGAHNVNVSDLRKASDDYRFDNECRSGSKSSGLSLGVEYAGAGLKLGKSGQSSSQFCKEHSQAASSQNAEYQYARNVVVEAYGAYIACKQLENEQVRARFKLLPRMVVLEVSRLTPAAIFKGLAVQPATALACTYNPGTEAVPVTRNTRIPLTDGAVTVITCSRNDSDASDGERYEGADLAVDTDRGSATVSLLPSYYPPPTTTEQLLGEIRKVEAASASAVEVAKTRITSLETFAGGWSQTRAQAKAATGTISEHGRVAVAGCPGGMFAISARSRYQSHPTGGGSYTMFDLTCQPIPIWSPYVEPQVTPAATTSPSMSD